MLNHPFHWCRKRTIFAALLCAAVACCLPAHARAQQNQSPAVTKVEPPNWWLKLTPEVMLLLSGHNLQATRVECNLSSLIVQRTQATAGGNYLFVWLSIGPDTKPGVAVCRITTPTGMASFELPLPARTQTIGRFQGLTPEDAIYFIMPDRFADGDPTNDEPRDAPDSFDRKNPRAYHGGDLRGIQDHLPYLKDLGVNTLWLTPIVKNGAKQDYHGYGAVDLYAVEPHLGALQEYRDLVNAAHRQHMKVLFDIVPNHVGPQHPWVTNPPTPDWFHGTPQHHANSSARLPDFFYGKPNSVTVTNDPFELLVDPHAPPQLWRNLTEGWFAGILPDMNTENPFVAQYLLQNAIWWAETSGLDGFRIDTFPYVSRRFWAEWHAGLHKIYPRMTTIGEVFDPDPTVTSFFAGGQKRGDGIDSGVSTVFDYPMYFAVRDVLLNGAPAGRIADVLRHDALYPHPDLLSVFFGNHDVTRFASAPGSTAARLKLAFGLTLTLRGIPELYYGDEIGMPGGGDPDNRRDFPGGWPGDSQNAFTEAGRTTAQQEIFAYVQKLLRLRREHPALAGGKLWHLASDDSAYVFLRDGKREGEEDRVVVAFNNSSHSHSMKISLRDTPASDAVGFSPLLGGATVKIGGAQIEFELPAESISIFAVN